MKVDAKKSAWLRVLMAFVAYAGGYGRVPAAELIRVAGDKAGMCAVVKRIGGDVGLFIKIFDYLCEGKNLATVVARATVTFSDTAISVMMRIGESEIEI